MQILNARRKPREPSHPYLRSDWRWNSCTVASKKFDPGFALDLRGKAVKIKVLIKHLGNPEPEITPVAIVGSVHDAVRRTEFPRLVKPGAAAVDAMRMIRRRHCILVEPGVTGEVRFVNKLFDLAA